MTQPTTPPTGALLCPTDFSAPAAQAINFAIDLAGKLGAAVDIVHVYQPLVYAMTTDVGPLINPEFEQSIRARLNEELRETIRRNSGHGVEIHGQLLEGQVAPSLVRYADSTNPQLIVLSTHGRSGLGRLVLGSIAERVVRSANQPVCTVRVHE